MTNIIEYQIGIGFDFKPIIVHHYIDIKKVKFYIKDGNIYNRYVSDKQHIRNKDILLRNKE